MTDKILHAAFIAAAVAAGLVLAHSAGIAVAMAVVLAGG